MSALETQIGGEHYRKLGRYQPWEVLNKWLTPEELRGFMKGTVIAYLARNKNGREDIEKAAHTLQIYLELTKQAQPDQLSVDGLTAEQVAQGVVGKCSFHGYVWIEGGSCPECKLSQL